MDEEQATLDGQFYEFARLFDTKRDGTIITLYRSDYWMRQSKIIDDRKVTMTDTGVLWWKYCKTEINWDEWCELLSDLCINKNLDREVVETAMTNCGIPGSCTVTIPLYRTFFDDYTPKQKLLY